MADLLLHEYNEALSAAAALWGADKGADITRPPRWTAPLGGLSCSFELDGNFRDEFLVPKVRIGSSSALPSDAYQALIIVRDNEATLQRALSCLASLGPVRVWLSNCPCPFCSGRGWVQSKDNLCQRCGGTGMRQPPPENSDDLKDGS